MHVLDDQQSRAVSASPLDHRGEGALPATASRSVVHRIIQGAQLAGLGKVKQVVEEDKLFRLDQTLRFCRGFGRARASRITGHIEIQQAPQQGRIGSSFRAGAEVEYQAYVAGKAGRLGFSLELDQAGLPIPASPRMQTALPRPLL